MRKPILWLACACLLFTARSSLSSPPDSIQDHWYSHVATAQGELPLIIRFHREH